MLLNRLFNREKKESALNVNHFGNAVSEIKDNSEKFETEGMSTSDPKKGSDNHNSSVNTILSTHEVVAFLNESHYGMGRYNGSNYKSREGLELGKKLLVSRFQNILVNLIDQRKIKCMTLIDQMAVSENLNDLMTRRFRQACDYLNNEIEIIQSQIKLAEDNSGWISECINKYELGYLRGVNDAINFESLFK
jgi:hypothetical protein